MKEATAIIIAGLVLFAMAMVITGAAVSTQLANL
jgi:hypothetical protein